MYLYFQVYFVLYNLDVVPHSQFTQNYYTSNVTLLFNCCTNPVVYMTSYGDFKKAMKKICSRGSVDREDSTRGANTSNS